jgi:hypothetical protein
MQVHHLSIVFLCGSKIAFFATPSQTPAAPNQEEEWKKRKNEAEAFTNKKPHSPLYLHLENRHYMN